MPKIRKKNAVHDIVVHNVSRLVEAKKKANKTLEQIAAEAGISAQTLRDIISGKSSPMINTLGNLADSLGVPLVDLIVEHRAEKPGDPS